MTPVFSTEAVYNVGRSPRTCPPQSLRRFLFQAKDSQSLCFEMLFSSRMLQLDHSTLLKPVNGWLPYQITT